jgi:malate dehydrogenase
MAVYSDGSYGVAKDIIFSFPVTCKNGDWNVVEGLEVSSEAQKRLDATEKELLEEKSECGL